MPAIDNQICFYPPDNIGTKLWRYMDFTRYIALLETKALYFSCIENLDDPFEGSVSRKNLKGRLSVQQAAISREDFQYISDLNKRIRKEVYVNCWHMNDYESEAMWKLYGKNAESVAIQTTYGKLKENLPGNVYIGKMIYVDYSNFWIPEDNPLQQFIHKRIAFEHEKEVRAMISDFDYMKPGNGSNELGKTVSVELEKLIENVFVSPTAKKWFFELVEKVTKKFNTSIPVMNSELSNDPVF